MAITAMTKVMIVTHRSVAADLLEALQSEGICQILDAEQAVITRDTPELAGQAERPRDIEQMLDRLEKAIGFLEGFTGQRKGLESLLAPRAVVDEQSYRKVVSDRQLLEIVDRCEQVRSEIDRVGAEAEEIQSTMEMLKPWAALETPVEQIGQLRTTVCLAGLVNSHQFEAVAEQLVEVGAAIEQVGIAGNRFASVVVCLKSNLGEVQKVLRAAEFEPVNFEPMVGTVSQLIRQHYEQLDQARRRLNELRRQAVSLAEHLLKLQILYDHFANVLSKERARGSAPATQCTLLLEGWVKKKDYGRVEQIVSQFDAATVTEIAPADDEEIPVEIENPAAIRPFEVITRLYGMPKYFNIDPTVFLTPFFALFFGLCLTDAGYGLVIIALMAFFIKKMQGDKKLVWMLGVCAAATVLAGALTGGWFGDAIQKFIPALAPVRAKLMWFDPMEEPMVFFKLSLALGYIQIMTGLVIAFIHNLVRRDYVAAVFDQLTWLVMLNSVVLFLAGKAGVLPAAVADVFGPLALVPAAAILLFSHREGSWAGRLGMGFYNVFSTIFYMGDVLSYLRLMALGMVTAGLAMAINVITEIAGRIPFVGIIAALLVFVGGHLFNMAINALGAFVHTLRLQYVEFFPKFLIGGGRQFEPLAKQYRHIYIHSNSSSQVS